MPLENNKVIFLDDENDDTFVPLFTDIAQLKDFGYTELDEVKISQIIDEIYAAGKICGFVINPFTHNFIVHDKIIELLRVRYKVYKLEEVKNYYFVYVNFIVWNIWCYFWWTCYLY